MILFILINLNKNNMLNASSLLVQCQSKSQSYKSDKSYENYESEENYEIYKNNIQNNKNMTLTLKNVIFFFKKNKKQKISLLDPISFATLSTSDII